MSGRGGIYDGPDGQKLYGDGREVEDTPMSEPTEWLSEDEHGDCYTYEQYSEHVELLKSRLSAEREKLQKIFELADELNIEDKFSRLRKIAALARTEASPDRHY